MLWCVEKLHMFSPILADHGSKPSHSRRISCSPKVIVHEALHLSS